MQISLEYEKSAFNLYIGSASASDSGWAGLGELIQSLLLWQGFNYVSESRQPCASTMSQIRALLPHTFQFIIL
jgi:hypothetical protein